MAQQCPSFEPDQTWVCIDPDTPGALCDIGCIPCGTANNSVTGNAVLTDGARYVAPADDIAPARNARGEIASIRSNELQWIPLTYTGYRAPCFVPSTGVEMFSATTCDCDPAPSTIPGAGDAPGEPITSPWPDCFAYEGWKYGSKDDVLKCRVSTDPADILKKPTSFSSSANDLFAPAFVRLGPAPACVANAFIPCTAESRDNANCGNPIKTWINGDTESRNLFNILRILDIDPQYVVPKSGTSPEEQARYGLINKALSFVRTNRINGLWNQLDLVVSGAPGNPNMHPLKYTRAFSAENVLEFSSETATIATTGETGTASWRITSGSFTVILIAYLSRNYNQLAPNLTLYARGIVSLDIGVHVDIAGTVNPDSLSSNVFPSNEKGRIVYRSGEQAIQPVRNVEIVFGLGGLMLGDGKLGTISSFGGIAGECCKLLELVTGSVIPAYNEFPDQISRQRIAGGITIGFDQCEP